MTIETPAPEDAPEGTPAEEPEPEVEALEVEADETAVEATEDEGEQTGDDEPEAEAPVDPTLPADNSAASPHPQDRERKGNDEEQ